MYLATLCINYLKTDNNLITGPTIFIRKSFWAFQAQLNVITSMIEGCRVYDEDLQRFATRTLTSQPTSLRQFQSSSPDFVITAHIKFVLRALNPHFTRIAG